MLSMVKQIALDFADLKFLEIGCKCGARIVLDTRVKNMKAPERCHNCGSTFDTVGARSPIDGFLTACQMLANKDQKFVYRVIADDPQPSA